MTNALICGRGEVMDCQNSMAENRKVRMALIGTGAMGRKYAAMITEGRVPHMELTAAVCRSEASRRWAEKELPPGTAVFDSSDDLFARPDLFDGVLIVTPHDSHARLAVTAFRAGKHVFCDKPAGISLMEARLMSREAEKAGAVYAMMFHQRLYSRYVRIKEILNRGELGRLLRISMENTEPYRTSAYHRSSPWHSTWAGEGGGVLINQGHHLLDVWQWLFGMPKEVYGDIRFGKYNDFTVDDESRILMDYGDGLSGSFFVTTGETVSREKLEVVGSRGTLILEGDTLRIVAYDQDSMEYGRNSSCQNRTGLGLSIAEEVYPVEKNYEGMLDNFAMAVLTGCALIAPGKEGERAMELANAAYLSAWTGRPVALPLDGESYQEQLQAHIRTDRKFGRNGESNRPGI